MNETLHEMAVRMRGGGHGYDCSNCPIRTEVKRVPCLICSLLCVDNAEEQIEVLKKWAAEHPKKTWLDLLCEKLPDSMFAKKSQQMSIRMSVYIAWWSRSETRRQMRFHNRLL